MPPQKRKRGRPAAAAVASPAEPDASQQTTIQRPRKRAKPSPPPSPSNRPSRASKRVDQPSSASQGKKPTKPGPAGWRKRSSLQDVQPNQAQNQPAQRKVDGRKKRKSAAGEDDGSQADVAPRKRGPKPQRRSSMGSPQNTARRSSAATADDEDEAPPSPPKPYPHVARRTRRIRRSHISAKWSPLTAPSLAAANTILTLAHRPILQRLSQTSQRRQHTFAALRLITNRINRRLSRGIPFPPATSSGQGDKREVELDFEGVLDGRAVLERQLDPALHAVELLKREKRRMENELEKDYETLRNLEAGARGQARQQRELLKKAHELAPDGRQGDMEPGEVVFKREDEEKRGPLFTDLKDEEMHGVALQLGGHVDSIRANLQQVDGIVPEMARSRAALQSVLMSHLDMNQYEKVVLG
ncbi:hypothetical protein NLU13_3394 [Sarocladium strictum]|uniref:Kinetochore protein fta7 n=1 Tax=Sarocladium strictum TaxID=5046 RepID=A0AA39L9Q1_SARSR|nr:hypothetical protein NLU13_3394 [Sarocladium strictum]